MTKFEKLRKKIISKRFIVGIVGVGYVGEALGRATCEAGIKTIGFEISRSRVENLRNQIPRNFHLTDNKKYLSKCDVICICVPTPLSAKGNPDTTLLENAAAEIANYLIPGQLIITESSVAPGTSKNIIKPILEKSGFTAGTDFYLGYSPERVDPGNNNFTVSNIPKVVSGINEESRQLTTDFYSTFVKKTVPVASMEAAELTKIMENVFRLVNITLVNEIAEYARGVNINIWEVIDAAATKPFGFLAHYPGPGAGGYCIPVLPVYLLDSAKKNKVKLPLIELATLSNRKQPEKIANMALTIMNGKLHKSTNGNGIKHQALLVGISYKENLGDTRESVALKIWNKLEEGGVEVHYHDPYVLRLNGFTSSDLNEEFLKKMDMIIVTTPHRNISYETLIASKKPLLDTRGVLNNYTGANIYHI